MPTEPKSLSIHGTFRPDRWNAFNASFTWGTLRVLDRWYLWRFARFPSGTPLMWFGALRCERGRIAWVWGSKATFGGWGKTESCGLEAPIGLVVSKAVLSFSFGLFDRFETGSYVLADVGWMSCAGSHPKCSWQPRKEEEEETCVRMAVSLVTPVGERLLSAGTTRYPRPAGRICLSGFELLSLHIL